MYFLIVLVYELYVITSDIATRGAPADPTRRACIKQQSNKAAKSQIAEQLYNSIKALT